jgi:hypothetical protein
LFVAYSRLESALKQADYLRKGLCDIAQADWNRFTEKAFLSDAMKVADEDVDVKAMSLTPPRTQIIAADRRSWVSEPNGLREQS